MPVPDGTIYKLLQVSDLHFGDIPAGFSVPPSAPSPKLIALSPLFEGQLGHHSLGVLALKNFYDKLRRQGGDFDMVVTGDVSANGAVAQFELADGFLGTGPSQFGYQLGRQAWADTSISGNHDNWDGDNWMVGGPTTGLGRYLRATKPPRERARKLPDGTILRMIFMDTDADIPPRSIGRITGRGAFDTQLQYLNRTMPPVGEREVRVLIMHHSVVGSARMEAHPTLPSPVVRPAPTRLRNPYPMMSISNASLRMLNHFIVEHSISVILTGHMHVALLSEMEATNGAHTRRYLEARCGSTTQRDIFEYEDLPNLSRKRVLRPNTLLMHEIVQSKGRLLWKTVVHSRAANGSFSRSPPNRVPAPVTPWEAELQLR